MFKREIPEFTSRLSGGETLAAIIYLPVHVGLLPLLAALLLTQGVLNEVNANFLCYAVGAVYMLLLLGRFLRRDFDPVCDSPMRIVAEVTGCYLVMMVCNMGVNTLLMLLSNAGLSALENPNNQAVFSLAGEDFGKISAMTVFLAPIVEELMFRAGVFGFLRRYNRMLAYLGSMLLFSAYHVWSYAVYDPTAWVYVIQYLPISWLLCRCYERTNSIWGSIFLHMLINGISMQAVQLLEEML